MSSRITVGGLSVFMGINFMVLIINFYRYEDNLRDIYNEFIPTRSNIRNLKHQAIRHHLDFFCIFEEFSILNCLSR